MSEIEFHMNEARSFEFFVEFRSKTRISSLEEYQTRYQRSIDDPEGFWAEMAEENLDWFQKWDTVLQEDWASIGQEEAPYVKWF